MFSNKYLLLCEFLVLLSAVGCANSPKKTDERTKPLITSSEEAARPVTSSVAEEAKAYNSVEIAFKPNSANLNDSAKNSLDALIKQAKSGGEIDEVIVLSWSDKEYPSKNIKKLPKQQGELAEKRNQAVTEYVKSLQNVEVDSYNMAKKPDALSKWFNTDDNKLKKSLLAAGLPTSADSKQSASKASRSVILIKIK
jgi:hypothetical protein